MSKQRLIDADALREHWHISEKCEECHWNNLDCSKPPYYSLHHICEAIDEVPTIDAIPMDWMESQYYKHMEIKDKYMSAYAIVLAEWNEWKREQEAR